MDNINLTYHEDRSIQFNYSCTDDLSVLFVKCGYCKFTTVYYDSISKIKIRLNNLVLSIFHEENNEIILERKLKTLECYKCKCKFSIANNIITIEKETIPLNDFLTKKEFNKKIETKENEIKFKEAKVVLKKKIIEAIFPEELAREEIEKVKAKERQREIENEKAGDTKKEEPKKIAFTFVTGGRKKK